MKNLQVETAMDQIEFQHLMVVLFIYMILNKNHIYIIDIFMLLINLLTNKLVHMSCHFHLFVNEINLKNYPSKKII